MEAFASLAQGATKEEFQAAKGPDFVSRLKGFVNVLGPDPQAASGDSLGCDLCHPSSDSPEIDPRA